MKIETSERPEAFVSKASKSKDVMHKPHKILVSPLEWHWNLTTTNALRGEKKTENKNEKNNSIWMSSGAGVCASYRK